MLLDYKILLGIAATILGISGYLPYFRDMLRKRIKPHAFSWLIWAILTFIAFSVSISKGGAAGAWTLGAQGILNIIIAAAAMRSGETRITGLDKLCLGLALFGIALWVVTMNSLWGVVISSIVDLIALVPTLTKAYKNPFEESTSLFILSGLGFVLSLFALGSFSLVTALYPSVIIVANTLLVLMILLRRRALAARKSR
jgi:hypothetical protein